MIPLFLSSLLKLSSSAATSGVPRHFSAEQWNHQGRVERFSPREEFIIVSRVMGSLSSFSFARGHSQSKCL